MLQLVKIFKETRFKVDIKTNLNVDFSGIIFNRNKDTNKSSKSRTTNLFISKEIPSLNHS